MAHREMGEPCCGPLTYLYTLILAVSSFTLEFTPTIPFLKTPENILFIHTETLQTQPDSLTLLPFTSRLGKETSEATSQRPPEPGRHLNRGDSAGKRLAAYLTTLFFLIT